jgi:membrane protease YdiL (CAAX protease family)
MHKKAIFWTALSALLFLRIPLASWTEYLWPATSAWVEPVYEVLTYLLIVFLIWWERQELAWHHLDFWAVLIVLFFKPLSVLLLPVMGNPGHPLALPHLPGILILIIALILGGLIVGKKINIGKPDAKVLLWFLLGSLAGIALQVLYGILMIRWLNFPVPPDPGPIAWLAPFYQLGYAAVSEEPLFRGFLWGGLRNMRVKEGWILLIQALLFAIAHIHLLKTVSPALFFGITFLNALFFGLVAWRSRSLAASMGMHGFANGSVLVQYWVYSVFF